MNNLNISYKLSTLLKLEMFGQCGRLKGVSAKISLHSKILMSFIRKTNVIIIISKYICNSRRENWQISTFQLNFLLEFGRFDFSRKHSNTIP